MNKKLGLLAIPVVAGLGALSVTALNSSAHAAPVTAQSVTTSQASSTKEAPDAAEAQGTTKADDPNGPNVEQTGQN
jgi:hypothetical protein